MKQFDTITNRVFSPISVCREIEQEHQPSIIDSCKTIVDYLRKNEQIEELPGSISDLAHITFYQLDEEIRRFFKSEQEDLFPVIRRAISKGLVFIDPRAIETNKESHRLILKIVKMLRQLMCDYVLQPHWGAQFRECIVELYCLENKIYKWIELEQELLFPQLLNEERSNTMATAC